MTKDDRRSVASARLEAGDAAFSAGKHESAETHFRAAYDLLSALFGTSPTLDDARTLARAALSLGEALFALRRPEEGERYLREAREVWEGVVDETDAVPDKRELARAVERLGSVDRDPESSDARRCLWEELGCLRREIWEKTEDTEDRRALARALVLLAKEADAREHEAAVGIYLDALSHLEAVASQTAAAEDRRALVTCGYDAALCLDLHRDPAAEDLAEASYNRARGLYEVTCAVEDARLLALLCGSLSRWAAEGEALAKFRSLAEECFAHWRRVIAGSDSAADRRGFASDLAAIGECLSLRKLSVPAMAVWEEEYLTRQGVFDRTGTVEDLGHLAFSCERVAEGAHALGQAEREEECRREALAMWLAVFEETQRETDGISVASAYLALADLTLAQERRGEAYRYYRSALAAAEKVSWDRGIHRARAGMAKLLS